MPTIGAVGEGLFEIGLDEGDARPSLRAGYGGDAANTAVMAARLRIGARLAGRVGRDALGRLIVNFWKASGVDTRWVIVDASAPTGIYVNERAAAGGHRFHYHRRCSAGTRLCPDDLADTFLDGVDVLHSSGITLAISPSSADAARTAFRQARAQGATTSFAVNYRPALGCGLDVLVDEARAADIVFLSLEDAHDVFGTDDGEEAVRALGRGPREVIITVGAKGALVAAQGAIQRVEAPPTVTVDTAGAGDALAGAYLASRLRGLTPAEALGRGVAAATLSCRAYGCALSYPNVDDMLEFMSASLE